MSNEVTLTVRTKEGRAVRGIEATVNGTTIWLRDPPAVTPTNTGMVVTFTLDVDTLTYDTLPVNGD